MLDSMKLIDCMRARTPLWNRQSPLYTARAMKKELWLEVVALTEATEDEVRRKWKCLNDIFRREHNKYALRKKQDPDAEPPQWIYYNHMLFLESQIGMRSNGQSSKKSISQLRDDEHDEHSLDSSLAFEDITNYADVSVKMELLDGNSLAFDEDVVDTESSDFQHVKKECQQNGAATNNDDESDEPATKRTRNAVCEPQQLNDVNLKQNGFNAHQQNVPLSVDSIRNSSSMPKVGSNIIATNVATQQVDAAIAQRLFSLEQRQFEDYRHMLQQVQVQQQQQRQTNNDVDNDDYHFALSLVPTMRGLPAQRKMLLRLKIQQLLCDETELLMNAKNDA